MTGKFERQAPGVMHMTVRSGEVRETITVTPNHPYLRPSDVIGKGVLELVKMDPGGDWTSVLKLKPGDELVSAFGVPLVVDSIDVDDAATRVYSLEVEGLHSFAVGELAAWVHNARIRGGKRGKVWDTSKGLCGICGKPMVQKGPAKGPRSDRFSCDHIIPQSKGGTDDLENLQGCHVGCNASKNNK